MNTPKEELALTADEAHWTWVRPHLARGGVFVVAAGLDIVEAGMKIAADDTVSVGEWLAAGKLARPSREEIALWDEQKEKPFVTLIVSPYVLIQEKADQWRENHE